MSTQEIKSVKEAAYTEALRYIDNARDTYKKAGKEGNLYQDKKYVRGAANYAYMGVLQALDAWLLLKQVPQPERRSIEWYRKEVGKLDRKMLSRLNAAYDILHLAGAYDGNPSVGLSKDGLKVAEEIVSKIKP